MRYKYKDGILYIDDMMNILPSYEDNFFKLTLTDFPFNVDYNGKGKRDDGNLYDDNFTFQDHIKWFEEIMRVSEGLYFVSGTVNLYDQIQYKKPDYLPKYCYLPNKRGYFHVDTYLGYGKIENHNNIIDVKVCKASSYKKHRYKHPSPKSLEYFFYVLKKIKPKNVLDPFVGSGTTLKACSLLGIEWVGIEINPIYKEDIDKRFNQKEILDY